MTETPPPDGQRIDRWLWHARLVRTRSAAAALAGSGHVRVNGVRIRAASRVVRQDDVITVALDRNVRVVKVRGFIDRRGPAAAGKCLYEELRWHSAEKARLGHGSEPCTPIGHALGARLAKRPSE